MSSPLTDEVLFSYIAVAPPRCEPSIDTNWQWDTTASLLCEQITAWGWNSLSTIGEGHPSSSTWYKKASPLLPSTYSHRPNSISTQGRTSKRWLYEKNCKMRHHSRGFWHQIHAPHLCQRSDTGKPYGWVCWTCIRGNVNNTEHG